MAEETIPATNKAFPTTKKINFKASKNRTISTLTHGGASHLQARPTNHRYVRLGRRFLFFVVADISADKMKKERLYRVKN